MTTIAALCGVLLKWGNGEGFFVIKEKSPCPSLPFPSLYVLVVKERASFTIKTTADNFIMSHC